MCGDLSLAVVSRDGNLSLVTLDGKVKSSIKLSNFSGKETRLLSADLNKDGNDEILVYGGKNFVEAYDINMDMLQGFPVRGGRTPLVMDLNSDGSPELVTAGYDDNVYAYTITE